MNRGARRSVDGKEEWKESETEGEKDKFNFIASFCSHPFPLYSPSLSLRLSNLVIKDAVEAYDTRIGNLRTLLQRAKLPAKKKWLKWKRSILSCCRIKDILLFPPHRQSEQNWEGRKEKKKRSEAKTKTSNIAKAAYDRIFSTLSLSSSSNS